MIKTRITSIDKLIKKNTKSEFNTSPSKSNPSVQKQPTVMYSSILSICRAACLNFDTYPLKIATVVYSDIGP